jgi:hypothetical protein
LLYALFPGAEVADGPIVYGFIVKKDFRGTQIENLLGGVVMAINPYTQVNIQTIFTAAGFPKDKWPEIRVASREAALGALANGQATAAIMDQPALAVALSSGDFRLLEANPRAKHIGSPYWSGSGAVKRDKWQEKHAAFARLMLAYDEAILQIRKDADHAHRILAKRLGLNEKIAAQCGGYYFPTSAEPVPTNGIKDTSDALVRAGLLAKPIDITSFFPPGIHPQP